MKRIALLVISLFAVISCSTTKLLPEGMYRFASSKLEVEDSDDKRLTASSLSQYVRQQPNSSLIFGWNPLLNVYNWSDGSGKGINGFWEKIGVAPVVFDPTLTQSSCENIANHLEEMGYYDSKVTSEVTYDDRLARVNYHVKPGKRYLIDEIVYEVPGGSFGEAFRADSANMTIHVGDYLSEETLEAETVRGAAVFREQGYYDFNKNHYFFEADTLTQDWTKLYYRIKPYSRSETPTDEETISQYRIGKVSISYPSDIPFRESLLRKVNTIRSGAWYSDEMINTAYTRFSALKVFNNVSIELSPADSAVVDCDILLSGTDLMGFKANVEASTNASGLLGFSPQVSFYHKNIFHGGEWLNLGFTGNWQSLPRTDIHSSEFGVSASLSFPRLLGFPLEKIRGAYIPRTEIKTAFNYQNRPEYRRSLATLTYGYTGQTAGGLYYQFYPLRLNLVKLFTVSAAFVHTLVAYPYLWDTFEDQLDAGVSAMLYHTTDASVVPKTAYHAERLSLDLSGNVLSLLNPVLPVYEHPVLVEHMILGLPYKQYVRGELDLTRVFRFGRNEGHALAMHFVAGAGFAYGNSVSMPFEKQFFCGGANSMRGWQARTLGPGAQQMNPGYMLPSQTGNLKLEADLEYRFPLFWKLEGGLFAEAGNVWLTVAEEGEEPFRVQDIPLTLAGDWGLGLRVNLDFILVRLDVGFKVHEPNRDPGRRWLKPRDWFSRDGAAIHFGVGYPF